MRQTLRAATAENHARVDALFAGFDLTHKGGYARFLSAQAAAFVPAERALDEAGAGRLIAGWHGCRRTPLLQEDLAELGTKVEELPAPEFADDAAVMGGAYVLEGSRLGGAFLSRSVGAGLPVRFLGAKPAPAWRNMLDALDAAAPSEEYILAAIGGARTVFGLFEASGRRQCEVAAP